MSLRPSLLIAWREYSENAKTKGFWIGLFLFPVIILASVSLPGIIERKATPSRYFVLVDASGVFDPVIQAGLDRAHHRRVLQELNEYTAKYANLKSLAGSVNLDLEKMSAPDADMQKWVQQFAEANPQALDAFATMGGQAMYLTRIKPFLKPDAPPFLEPQRRYLRVPLPAGVRSTNNVVSLANELRPWLRGQQKISSADQSVELYAAILIPADIQQHVVRPTVAALEEGARRQTIQYWSGNVADTALRDEVERSVNDEIRRREYLTRGIDSTTVRQIERTHIPFSTLNPKKEEGKEKVSLADVVRQWAPSGFVYLLWVAIFSIAQMLLANTIEEKSNRIIEVLLSSVTPGELMLGKLIGIAGVGLTMVTAWILALFGVLAWKAGPESELALRLFEVLRGSNLLPAFGFYFLFGYLMYSAVFMAIGSICNTLKEAQNFMGVVTLILLLPLFTMVFIPKDPNGTLATVLSWIPLYTPFVMMNRATADPPWFDLIGTMILMVVSTGLAIWLSAKIFRIGILRTGQPPRLIELIRWLRS